MNNTSLTVGMVSKSVGQILRVSVSMHALFHIDNEDPLPDVVSHSVLQAAIDFVEVCYQLILQAEEI